jgi:predicted unusual protein kinase regulating ubiquinone biosynthesis (AarF/ABC1/UbiB family)
MSDQSERNRFSGRLGRYARVSGSIGGIATKMAANKLLGRDLDKAANAAEIREALGGLKGPVMKVAQILATIPDALPREYAQELGQLQADAPAMGWMFVKRRMKGELGPNWQSHYKEFAREAISAASLGQVHKATSLDGQDLAVKLQYPDMASAVEADVKQMNLFLNIAKQYDPSVDTSEIRKELADRLREELDYEREAQHMAMYRHMLKDSGSVHVPEHIPELSTKRLLTMSWVEGKRLLTYKDADLETRNAIAINMFNAWYIPFHRYGIIHGDPHLGNYTVRDDLTINLLDFGCVRIFPPKFVGGVINLYKALRDGDHELAVHAYETWGFENLSKELVDTLNIWASLIYGPLMEDRPRLIAVADNPGEYGREQAAKVHKKLKDMGPVTPPREFVFMDRAAVGLGGVFLHLRAELNWHRLFQDIIEDYDTSVLAKRQEGALQAAGLEL